MMMKNKCKKCGANSDSEYCFKHKPRKSLTKKMSSFLHQKLDKSTFSADRTEEISKMREFFNKIWKKKIHYSEISNTYLGKEPLSVFFHHILPKEKHPEARLDEENIVLLTLDEHTDVENDMYKYPEINRRRELLKQKYERTKESV